MITQAELQMLAGIDAGEARILSVQLDLSPVRQIQRDDIVAFDDLVRRTKATLDDDRNVTLSREAKRVRTFLSSEPPSGLGLVIYSCRPIGLWRVYRLPTPVADDMSFSRYPRIRPLVDLVDENERMVIALVDSESARVLALTQVRIEDSWSRKTLVPGRHQQGGWSQANFQRHHDHVVDEHLRSVIEELTEFNRREPFTRLFVAGPDEPLNRFLHLMPDELRRRVAARVPGEMFQSDAELIRASIDAAHNAERNDELRLVQDLLETASNGGRAIGGRDAVLHELLKGSIEQLTVADGLHADGSICRVCGRLVAVSYNCCPACGGDLAPFDDIIDEAIRRTLESGGSVEIVHGPAADALLTESGGIAARLRYRSTTLSGVTSGR
ncbi:MAG: Vms1/Ankzf1 family peptidyl-tRNA hydrolase [Thermomicrobiales bacterium]